MGLLDQPVGEKSSSTSWFGCKIKVDIQFNAWMIELGKVGKGLLYVNGVLLGRYRDIPRTSAHNSFLKYSPIVQVQTVESASNGAEDA